MTDQIEKSAKAIVTDPTHGALDAIKAVSTRWLSFVDAASEKQAPSKYLSPSAISAIQGTKSDGT